MTGKIAVAVDVVERRPGCVLVQAALGGDNAFVGRMFPARSWLLAPTENMRLISGTMKQWEQFASELDRRFP